MDLLYFVDDKLRFIERHYSRATEPFTAIKRKIEEGEEPYGPGEAHYDSGDEEPPFTDEWIEADESLNLVGYSCLCLVQSVLLEYLREYVRHRGCSLPEGKGALLQRYQDFFKQGFGVDWEDGPVDVRTLEDLTLARNHIQHETSLSMKSARQSADYVFRFPRSSFRGRFCEIRVTEEALKGAISAVEEFCKFIEQQ